MIDFIMLNFEAVAGVILAICIIVYALITRQWSILQVAALRLMLNMERIMATSEGQAKMEMVYATMWKKLPGWMKRFVSEKTMRQKLQDWYNLAKNSLNAW